MWLAMVLLLALASCSNLAVAQDCRDNRLGLNYAGNISTTNAGCTCRPWTDSVNSNYPDAMFVDGSKAAAGNRCRNPGRSSERPWCYIVTGTCTVSTGNYDHCDNIPICSFSCRETEEGAEYNGAISTSASGTSCIAWNSVFGAASASLFTADPSIPSLGVCRNIAPDSSNPFLLNTVPWCLVNPGPTLANCNVPFCSQINPTGCRTDHLGSSYRGNQSTSVTGKSCIRWDSASVYSAGTWPNSPSESITDAANHCRNPNNSPVGLWCLVSTTEWEPCLVPACIPVSSCPNVTTDSYRYKDFLTYSGCTSWSSVYTARASTWYISTVLPPTAAALRSPLFIPSLLPDLNLGAAKDYCRNPDNDITGPWCPTVGGTKQYCTNPCSLLPCLTDTQGLYYAGTVAQTRSGVPCQSWVAQSPISHPYARSGWFPDGSAERAKNFCRTPDRNKWGPWCYKSNYAGSGSPWDYCNVPFCTGYTTVAPTASTNTDECLKSTAGLEYSGTKSNTSGGNTCLSWEANSANHPYYLPQMFNAASMSQVQNYCRNPDSSPTGPWCYVAARTRETCSIVQCSPTVNTTVTTTTTTTTANTTTTTTTSSFEDAVTSGVASAIAGGGLMTMLALVGAMAAAFHPSGTKSEPLIQPNSAAPGVQAAPPPPSNYQVLKTTKKVSVTTKTTDTTVDEYEDLTTTMESNTESTPPPTVSETVTKSVTTQQQAQNAAYSRNMSQLPPTVHPGSGGAWSNGAGPPASSSGMGSAGMVTRSGGGGGGMRGGQPGGSSYTAYQISNSYAAAQGGGRGGGGGGGEGYGYGNGSGSGYGYGNGYGNGYGSGYGNGYGGGSSVAMVSRGGASYSASRGGGQALSMSQLGGGGSSASYMQSGVSGGRSASHMQSGGGGGSSASYMQSGGGGGSSASRYGASASSSGGGGGRIVTRTMAASDSSAGGSSSAARDRNGSIVDEPLASYVSNRR